jgi:hypothetical protein
LIGFDAHCWYLFFAIIGLLKLLLMFIWKIADFRPPKYPYSFPGIADFKSGKAEVLQICSWTGHRLNFFVANCKHSLVHKYTK